MRTYSPDSSVSAKTDLQLCKELLRNGSRTFLAASHLLPRQVRDPACALYAFCRIADDEVDLAGSQSDPVGRMRSRLEMIYAGTPYDAAPDRALARVVEMFEIPRALPEALLDGFAWDAEVRRYADIAELEDYAARVAGSVGAMMALIMGVRESELVARACDLGVAMQLSNIARDVGEDARAGRLYLPLDWLQQESIDVSTWMDWPHYSPSLARVVARLLQHAEILYVRAEDGIAGLPWRCRPAIQVARVLYAEIGREVAHRGYDSVGARAVVSGKRKATLFVGGLMQIPMQRRKVASATLKANQFLVDAIALASLHAGTRSALHVSSKLAMWQRFDDRVGWLVDLCTRLEQRDANRVARV